MADALPTDVLLDAEECRDDRERALLAALDARARTWAGQGITADSLGVVRIDDRLVVLIDIDDPDANLILRVLRIELDRDRVLLGEDATMQGGPNLAAGAPGVEVIDTGDTGPAALAARIADWVERELARPIERREWATPAFHHVRHVLADTGDLLCWADSANDPRLDRGPPDRVTRIRPLPQR